MGNKCLNCGREFKEKSNKKFCSKICNSRFGSMLRYKKLGKKAFEEGKIYFLCIKCHGNLRKK
jgi:hypothetical protein